MKRKKIVSRITMVSAILVFVIAFVETQLYYFDVISNKCYLFFMGIFNGIRIFGFDSSIDLFDILQLETENVSLARSLLNNAYILCYFGAPVITAKCAIQVIGYIVKEKLIDFNFSGRKKRILIVGYNEYVEKLLKNTLNSKSKNVNNRKILVLHKTDIPDVQKFRFQMLGISFQKYEKLDYNNVSDANMILKWMVPKKIKQIVLFEKNDMDNVSNYCFFLKCFEKNSDLGFTDGLQIDCNYDLTQVENLIWDCFDRKEVELKYRMNTFSVPMLRAQSVLEKVKVYDNILVPNEECKDIHLLIIGFGKMGKRFFKRALNESVISEKNNIVVDIFEKDVKQIKKYLAGINKSYYGCEENTIHIDSTVLEGDLKIRFHAVDVDDNQFIERMEVISQDNPFTYIAICVDKPETSVASMLNVENYVQRIMQKVPILVRMDSGQELKELEDIYINLKLVPGDDEILSLENIHSNELETISNDIHKRDSEIQKNKHQVAYQIEARKYRVLHYKAKTAVYNMLNDKDKERINNIFISTEYKEEANKKLFINRIENDEILFKFGAIEHRRWGYYVIFNGWSYKEEKNDIKKVTPYLCPFKEILSNDKLRKSAYFEYKDWNEIITKNNEIGELLCHTQHGKR